MLNARVWSVIALAVVARTGDADACECRELVEAEAIEHADVVFDGWVIAAPSPWKCAVPAAPKPKAGCVRISVVDPESCKPYGDFVSLRDLATDEPVMESPDIGPDATTFCKVKAGTYQLVVREIRAGDEDGTTIHGRRIDVVPGGSYVVYGGGRVGQKLRLGVGRSLKGDVRREVNAITHLDCGTAYFDVGSGLRFFGKREPDGSIDVSGCWGSRGLTDQERAELVSSPPRAAAIAAVPPPRSAGPTSSGSCAASAPSSWVLALLAIALGVFRTRRLDVVATVERSARE